jgi:hypothetical protein
MNDFSAFLRGCLVATGVLAVLIAAVWILGALL